MNKLDKIKILVQKLTYKNNKWKLLNLKWMKL